MLAEALALLGWQGVSLKRGSESEEGARCKAGPSCRRTLHEVALPTKMYKLKPGSQVAGDGTQVPPTPGRAGGLTAPFALGALLFLGNQASSPTDGAVS